VYILSAHIYLHPFCGGFAIHPRHQHRPPSPFITFCSHPVSSYNPPPTFHPDYFLSVIPKLLPSISFWTWAWLVKPLFCVSQGCLHFTALFFSQAIGGGATLLYRDARVVVGYIIVSEVFHFSLHMGFLSHIILYRTSGRWNPIW